MVWHRDRLLRSRLVVTGGQADAHSAGQEPYAYLRLRWQPAGELARLGHRQEGTSRTGERLVDVYFRPRQSAHSPATSQHCPTYSTASRGTGAAPARQVA